MRPAKTMNPPKPLSHIRVRSRPGTRAQGIIVAGDAVIPVALGRAGIFANKREGDGATPRGTFHPIRVWWRADRGPPPRTALPLRRIGTDDAWSEDPRDRNYNKPLRRRAGEAGDRLRRKDHLYDIIVEIDHNTRPRIAGRGSAVFIHLARPGFLPTAGCVALTGRTLRWLVARLTATTRIEIS
jgi:L,D-peptidoglycan transpeptidase YkuD (ErfK/YbiS/YcfS/YnhG family)